MAGKPRVFVSSTVYDFRDLRSALKYWLEELGYEVLLSEHTDFPVQADLSSYHACLQAIDSCDYMILLIGGRVGGWYDKQARVSITQAEYRHGYSRLLRQQIKLITFVRQELWNVRQDRKELQTLLQSGWLQSAELGEAEVERLAKHPSKFANDADFTFCFLDEIARADEMRAAQEGLADPPIGNWIRQFTDFRSIVDALKVEFGIDCGVRRAAIVANLLSEIEANLSKLMYSHAGAASPTHTWAAFARRSFAGGFSDHSEISGKDLMRLSIFTTTGCSAGQNLTTVALDWAITSGEFLEFSNQVDGPIVGELQSAMLDVRRNIERLRSLEGQLTHSTRVDFLQRFGRLGDEALVTVPNVELLLSFAIHDCQADVLSLLKAVYNACGGSADTVGVVRLYGDSPLPGESEKIERECPTSDQVRQWLRG